MNRSKLFIVSLVSALLLVFSTSVISQDAPAPTLPDYANWEKNVFRVDFIVDNKNVNLAIEQYQYTDVPSLKRYTVNVLYNEQHQAWIATYFEETGENVEGGIVTKESKAHVFESRGGKWIWVKSLLPNRAKDETAKEIVDFLEMQYNLRFPR